MDVPEIFLKTGDDIEISDSWNDAGQDSTNKQRADPFQLRLRHSLDDLLENSADMNWREPQDAPSSGWSEEYAVSSLTASSPSPVSSLSKAAAQDYPNRGDALQKPTSSEGSAMRLESIAPARTDLKSSPGLSGPSTPKADRLHSAPSLSVLSTCKDCGKKLFSESEAK
jgi:hypothetical protein